MKSKNSKYPRVNPIDIKDKDTITELMTEFHSSGVFGPGRIAKAVDIYTEMIKQKSTVFLGIAGALVPGGMRKILTDMIKEGMVHVIVSTGANVTHDLIEAFGGKHIRHVPFDSDQELRDKSIDRIYDAFVADESFIKLEEHLQPIFKEIWDTHKDDTNTLVISTRKLMALLGEKIDDENSFVKAAYDNNVPIYVPALADCIVGLQLWLFSQLHRTLIDDMDDLGSVQRLAWDSEKAGAFFLGGGVPKNYIFQSRLMSPKTFDYAIQITMDRVETGGLSGASLEEAVSWGKVSSKSRMINVVSDITIALPLIFQATLNNLRQSD